MKNYDEIKDEQMKAFNCRENEKDESPNALLYFLFVMVLATLALFAHFKARAAPTDSELMAMMRMQYENDIKNDRGRMKWHGQMTSQVVDTNALVRIDTYADGTAFTNKWQSRAKIALRAQKKRMASLTNNVPARLADARLRREEEKQAGVKEVVVETNVGNEFAK